MLRLATTQRLSNRETSLFVARVIGHAIWALNGPNA